MVTPLLPVDRGDRIALLLDAENVEARSLPRILNELTRLGRVTVRRAFGNFADGSLRPWIEFCSRHAVVPCQQIPGLSGKNAADIALCISAMDLLHSDAVDAFAIASSDGDFTPLTVRLREDGLSVYVFGHAHAPARYRNAATRFVDLHSLAQELPQTTAAPLNNTSNHPQQALPFLRDTIRSITQKSAEWVPLVEIERLLSRRYPDFDCRAYGELSLKDLVAKVRGTSIQQDACGIDRVRVAPGKGRGRTRKAAAAVDSANETASSVVAADPNPCGPSDSRCQDPDGAETGFRNQAIPMSSAQKTKS